MPPSRWVVNFDFDLLDGLVLAAVLAAYVPFLVSWGSSFIKIAELITLDSTFKNPLSQIVNYSLLVDWLLH